MIIDENFLKKIGFVEFIHLDMGKRDGKQRLGWMHVVSDEIITIRLILIGNEWQVDYISPAMYIKDLVSINDIVKFVES